MDSIWQWLLNPDLQAGFWELLVEVGLRLAAMTVASYFGVKGLKGAKWMVTLPERKRIERLLKAVKGVYGALIREQGKKIETLFGEISTLKEESLITNHRATKAAELNDQVTVTYDHAGEGSGQLRVSPAKPNRMGF